MRLLVPYFVLAVLFSPVLFAASQVRRGGPDFRTRVSNALGGVAFGLGSEAGEIALVDDLQSQFDRVVKQATEVAEKATAEGRDLNEAERPLVKQWVDEAKQLKAKLAEAKADSSLMDQVREFEKGIAGGDGPRAASKGTMGQRFVKDAGLVDYLKQVIPNGGYIGEKTRIQSPAVQFNGIHDLFGRKDIFSSGDPDAGPGTLVVPDFRGLLDIGTWMRPLVLRDIIGSGTTESDTINYARIIDVTNNAAAVPEASGTSAGDASGDVTGTKPESSMDFERVEDTVKTIAHWLPITKRALADAGQVRTIADNFLQYGLEEQLEDQMISGDGTGENFEGLLNVSGTQAQAFVTDILVTIRKAKTKARKVGRVLNPSVLLSPEDDETIELQRDTIGRFFGNGPFGTGPNTLWGMPKVITESVPTGTAIVGGFNWAVLYDRQQAAVMLSDSHEDFFVRNLVAILAELRAGFGVIRPKAFVITELS